MSFLNKENFLIKKKNSMEYFIEHFVFCETSYA